MEHRLQLGGVPATYSRGLVLQTGYQCEFCFVFILSTSMHMLGIYLKLVCDSFFFIYCLVQTQQLIICSTPDVGGG
jgi:hypothetical protein